jgi:hypothetical protein
MENDMAKAYDKDFLINVYMSRFTQSKLLPVETLVKLESQANEFYDKVGKLKFRTYASVTPDLIKEYQHGSMAL